MKISRLTSLAGRAGALSLLGTAPGAILGFEGFRLQCPSDLDGNCTTDVDDLVTVILNWS